MRPFLKWAGNKYRLIDEIKAMLPPGKRLIEPFMGSGAVFLNTDYPEYLLGENNADLINLYHYVAKEGTRFIRYAKQYFVADNNTKENFLELRQTFNQTRRSRLRAALFLYLTRHCYNGLCRFNAAGEFNVPLGDIKKPYFPEAELHHFHQKAKLANFVEQDFVKTLEAAKPGDVVYCDPPYVPLSKTANFTTYTGQEFTESHQLQLADLARQLSRRRIPVIISNHDTPFTRQAYQQAKLQRFTVQRFISRDGNNRTRVPELLAIFNY